MSARRSTRRSTGGVVYGWRIMEGRHCYNPATGCSTAHLKFPVVEYTRRGLLGDAVYRRRPYDRMCSAITARG